jgi:hypothetical protein
MDTAPIELAFFAAMALFTIWALTMTHVFRELGRRTVRGSRTTFAAAGRLAHATATALTPPKGWSVTKPHVRGTSTR